MATHADFLALGLQPWQLVVGPDSADPLQGGILTRSDTLESFVKAIAWVQTIATLAEHHNHHPDIDIRYNTVILRVFSHDTGGLTDRDLRFAQAVNRLTI